MEMVRIATCGSVDDGKSTLIGRLLYDSKQIFVDQMEAIEDVSNRRGSDYVDLALLTDGLRAEREQGITIDVAYRYFATPKRKFVLADTPGHIQYTRNMVTGASTADVALVLLDARKGVLEQTKRHAFLSTLLGVPHMVVCVNKMDLVDYAEARFNELVDEFSDFASRLDVGDLRFVPVSALVGDNVIDRSEKMGWYQGMPLLPMLEQIHVASDRNLIDVRFPVQYVIRPHRMEYQDFRGYAGTVAGGVLTVGDEITVLPSGFTSTVSAIETADGPLESAEPPMSVVISLADDIDISRGDMICRPHNQPHVGQDIDLMACWMSSDRKLEIGDTVAVKHTTRWVRAKVTEVQYRLDVNTMHRDPAGDSLDLNEIGRVRIRTSGPLLFDEYRRNRNTGALILVDETTNSTLGAGMIIGPA